jgi:tRNA nucleotidyltransferase (CCA-adding enzyme)
MTASAPHLPEDLRAMVAALGEAEGHCLLAGGGVIDHTLGLEIKDWDIEVYGLTYQQVLDVLSTFGTPGLVGKSFGVVKIRKNHVEYDFSIPRKDNRIGKGHKGFTVDLLPDLLPEEASRRRDITINSMYLDLHTFEIIDPHGGLEDLKNGCIRATDPETFIEDPLRVLRIMQLLPRKGKFVDPATIALCKTMIDDFDTLPGERVYEEFKKLLLKASQPSHGLQFLADCGWIEKMPELNALRGCPQNPVYHPEGDVWVHTLMALDNAAFLLHHVPANWRLGFMFGVLCHDVGKPETIDLKTLTTYGHENVGRAIAGRFLKRMTSQKDIIDQTLAIVYAHMRPGALFKAGSTDGAWRRLHNTVPLQVLAWVTQADGTARTGRDVQMPVDELETMLGYGRQFGKSRIGPVLLGRHLIERGHRPGPGFKQILDRAFQYQLDTGCMNVDELYQAGIQK